MKLETCSAVRFNYQLRRLDTPLRHFVTGFRNTFRTKKAPETRRLPAPANTDLASPLRPARGTGGTIGDPAGIASPPCRRLIWPNGGIAHAGHGALRRVASGCGAGYPLMAQCSFFLRRSQRPRIDVDQSWSRFRFDENCGQVPTRPKAPRVRRTDHPPRGRPVTHHLAASICSQPFGSAMRLATGKPSTPLCAKM